MIEVYAHNYLKNLLKKDSLLWPHNLTLSRLVARSLRRRDKSIFDLQGVNHNDYWFGVLIPLCLNSSGAALVVTPLLKQRLFQVEIPKLKDEGLDLVVWEGDNPPSDDKLWVLSYEDFLNAYDQNFLGSKQFIFTEAELLTRRLREVMSIQICSSDWDSLRRAHPLASSALVDLYEDFSQKMFSSATRPDGLVRIDLENIFALTDLLGVLAQLPKPWPSVLDAITGGWASWAQLDYKLLDWTWHLQPLEPLGTLRQFFIDNPFITLSTSAENELFSLNEISNVRVKLGSAMHQEPIRLFAPFRQPLPNAECFAEHLLDQSRRLVLGRQGLTIILLDDDQLLRKLTSELAAEFGKRVVFCSTAPDSNGIICCTSKWWLDFQNQLPAPEQLIIALLPISSLESPLTFSRVEAFKKQGLDWFRDLLLPELLSLLPRVVLPVRKNHGRIAILDGRLRARAWGEKVFDILQPWIPLERLLPD